MPSLYDVSAEAQGDLFDIWQRIAEDSIELADRIETNFTSCLHPWVGCRVQAIPGKTSRPDRFFSSPCIHSLSCISRMWRPIRITAVRAVAATSNKS